MPGSEDVNAGIDQVGAGVTHGAFYIK
jgi:hypothetical protein